MDKALVWILGGFWLFIFLIAIILDASSTHDRDESGCTGWYQTPDGWYGQCGDWGVWQHNNTNPWPSQPWLPGPTGIPNSPHYPGGSWK